MILVPLRFRDRSLSAPQLWARSSMAASRSCSEKGWLLRSSSCRVRLHFSVSRWRPFLDDAMLLLLKYSPQYRHSSSVVVREQRSVGREADLQSSSGDEI